MSMPPRSLILAGLLCLVGCASTPPDGTATPKLARLSPEELQRLAPDAPKIGFPELVLMAKSGLKTEAIIARLKETGTRLDPTPSQVLDLTRQGVPVAVLDYLHDAREKALRTDLATLLTERDEKHTKELEALRQQEQLRNSMACDPLWCGPGFGWPGYYRRGGAYYGW
ncbi:MAG: hypothetical protein KGN39_03355 [Betaproteobacteria bacterium]|nr:hypothetical protein [Betaproteobacteria bacterium]